MTSWVVQVTPPFTKASHDLAHNYYAVKSGLSKFQDRQLCKFNNNYCTSGRVRGLIRGVLYMQAVIQV